MKEPAIVASVLGADYARLGQEVAELEAAGVDRIQWDIMECIRHVLDQVDVLLIMTVNPGFGGQAYLQTMEPKVAEAPRLIERSRLPTLIEVDGGISATTGPDAVRAGAQLLVAGSAILVHPEGRPAAVAELRRSLQPDLQAPPEGRAELESDTYATGGIHDNPRDG